MKNDLVKVAVVDDHTIMREGLIKQLAVDKTIDVIMEATDGSHMLQQLTTMTVIPDIAIVDLNMPRMDGFALAWELKNKYPQIRVLILSAYCSEYNIARMINNGVRGYLLKNCSPVEFREAIHSIYETGYYYSDLANEQVFKVFQSVNLKTINIPDREMEFLKLCCTELTYDQMAKQMGISRRTLDGCRERLFDRLSINSRTGLVLFALQSGIIAESHQPIKLKIKF